MRIRHSANGAVRILLTDRELKRLGVDLLRLRENDPRTAAVLRHILQKACPETLLTVGQQLTAAAIPTNGGCLLLLTPRPREAAPLCLYTDSTAAAKQLLAALRRLCDGDKGTVAVYRVQAQWVLLLYGAPLSADTVAALSELAGAVCPDRLTRARICEYGTPLFIGALSQLTAPVFDG